jgi:hypothetical protein
MGERPGLRRWAIQGFIEGRRVQILGREGERDEAAAETVELDVEKIPHATNRLGSWRAMERFAHGARIATDPDEIRSGREARFFASLFPIPQGAERGMRKRCANSSWLNSSARQMIFTCGLRFMRLTKTIFCTHVDW